MRKVIGTETQKVERKFQVSEVSNMHRQRRSLLPIAGFLLMAVVKTYSQGLSPQQTVPPQEINALVGQEYSNLFQLYRHLHAHPELSFREAKTAERIGKELGSAGFRVTANFGGNGFVG